MSAIHWLNDSDGDFGVAADWSGGVVPGASDGAVLDAAGAPFTVTASVSEKVKSLALAANATLDITGGTFTSRNGTGAGANAGSIIVGAGASFDVGGTLDNTGGITLQGTSEAGGDMLLTSNTTLSGGGTLTLGGVGTGYYQLIEATSHAGTVTLTNVDNTISGTGVIVGYDSGAQTLTLINQSKGVIGGTENNVRSLMILSSLTALYSPSTIVNDGVIESKDGASVVINNSYVSGRGGTIVAEENTSIYFTYILIEKSTIIGQSLATDYISSIINIEGSSITIGDNIKNVGNINFLSSDLTFDENVTLSGGGTLTMVPLAKGEPACVVSGTSSSILLTNVDNTIEGEGVLGDRKLALINESGGTILVNGGALTIDTGANTIVNAGSIEIVGALKKGASILVKSAIDNTGVIADAYAGPNSSTLTVDGAVTGSGQVTMAGGRVDFESSFNEAVTFTGATGTLVLAQSQAYTASITGFSTTGGTSLDLKDIGFVSANEATFSGTSSSGVLTVTDGTHTARIALVGDYLDSTFTCAGDGFGGVLVTDPPSPHAFVAAMAGFGPPGGQAVHSNEAVSSRERLLTAPGVAIA